MGWRGWFALFNNPLPDVLGPLERFSIGLMGAVTLGWGMTFYAAFQAAYALEASAAARIWRSITIAAVVWYVVDSFISISTGFALNAVSNTLFLIGYFLPILRSGVMVSR
ncbi:MAG: hypothetical protein U5J78_01910 [Parasphingorhabdus sp.]|nr:hypothetical protein [Parasphingorhabdus sp.]